MYFKLAWREYGVAAMAANAYHHFVYFLCGDICHIDACGSCRPV